MGKGVSLRKPIIFLIALALACSAVGCRQPLTGSSVGVTQPAPMQARGAAAAGAMLEAAREVNRTLARREREQEPLTPSFLNLRIEWMQRLRKAQLAAEVDASRRLSLIEDHIKRLKAYRDFYLRDVAHSAEGFVSEIDYAIAEAELDAAHNP